MLNAARVIFGADLIAYRLDQLDATLAEIAAVLAAYYRRPVQAVRYFAVPQSPRFR